MPYDGNGNYVPLGPPVFPAVPDTDILASSYNSQILDIGNALSNVWTLDGQKKPTANFDMGGYTLKNLAAPTQSSMPLRVGDIQSNSYTNLTSVAGTASGTITALASAGLASYTLGQLFQIVPDADNTGAVTLNVNDIGAKAVVKEGNIPLASGDLQQGRVTEVYYDGTNFQLVQQPSFSDETLFLYNKADSTKKAGFSLSLITTAVKRIFSWPDKSGTIALKEDRIGEVFLWPFATPPAGAIAVPLNATNVLRSTYPVLHAISAAHGYPWGSGDGSTTFGIPYLQADGTWLQANGNLGTTTVGQVISHSHTLPGGYRTLSGGVSFGSGAGNMGDGSVTSNTGGSANIAAGSRGLWCIWVG